MYKLLFKTGRKILIIMMRQLNNKTIKYRKLIIIKLLKMIIKRVATPKIIK